MSRRLTSSIICCDDFNESGFTMMISSDGKVYSFGRNNEGAHGHKEDVVFPPKIIPSLHNIQSVDCGLFHTLCVDNNNTVYSFGSNYFGQLGVGKDSRSLVFTHEPQCLNLPPIKQICCGGYFNMCITESGDCYTFGNNEFFQLGLDTTVVCLTSPQKNHFIADVDFVACGNGHTICKTLFNEIYVWGRNGYGQLGIRNTGNQHIPFKSKDWPDDIVDIKCGDNHTLVLTSNQEVYSCGDNSSNELGRDLPDIEYGRYFTLEKVPTLSEIIRIECGNTYSSCIDINNNLFIFGNYRNSKLGCNDIKKSRKPIKHPTLSDIIDISKGGDHIFIKTSKNEMYALGANEYSQLGIETKEENHSTPIQIFQNNEDIWGSNISRPRAKSARFLPPTNEKDTPPKKKQKIN